MPPESRSSSASPRIETRFPLQTGGCAPIRRESSGGFLRACGCRKDGASFSIRQALAACHRGPEGRRSDEKTTTVADRASYADCGLSILQTVSLRYPSASPRPSASSATGRPCRWGCVASSPGRGSPRGPCMRPARCGGCRIATSTLGGGDSSRWRPRPSTRSSTLPVVGGAGAYAGAFGIVTFKPKERGATPSFRLLD